MLSIAPRLARSLFGCLAALACTACASYSYDITRPSDKSTVHVDSKQEANLSLAPLNYHMQVVDGRLVLLIGNEAGDEVQLLGDKSFVIDPDGISHPLRSQDIQPNSTIKQIVPPLRPEERQSTPSIGPQTPGPFGSNDQPGYIPPPDFNESTSEAEGSNSPYYWQWEGAGDIRLHLVYQWGKSTFQQDFSIQRTK